MVRLEEEFSKEGTRASKIGLGMERGPEGRGGRYAIKLRGREAGNEHDFLGWPHDSPDVRAPSAGRRPGTCVWVAQYGKAEVVLQTQSSSLSSSF